MAVADDQRIVALLPGDETRTHGERLPTEIARALDAAGIRRDRIDLLAVATGPGAFTGLRIGLSAIQGLSMALDKPVIGISALEALAEQVQTIGHAAERSEVAAQTAERSKARIIVPWMDAQRGDVFATVIDQKTAATLEPPTAANPQLLLEEWRAHLAGQHVIFIGDAAARDAAIIQQRADGRWETRTPTPLAPQIALLALQRALKGEGGLPHTLEPIYVRRPDAEIEREKRRGL